MSKTRPAVLALLLSAATTCTMAQKPLSLDITVPGSPEYRAHANYHARGMFIDSSGTFVHSDDSCFHIDEKAISRSLIDTILTQSGKSKISVPVKWATQNTVWTYSTADQSLYKVNIDAQRIEDSITHVAEYDFDMSPNNKYAAFSTGSDLYVADHNGKRKVNGDDSKPGIIYGQPVHRNEFGIEKGTFWSNSGQLLAFYRMDESMVGEYPLVDITQREATANHIRYPMAGDTSHFVQIGIFNAESQDTLYLKTQSPINRYFTNIAWSPDDKFILVAEINREQNHMWMNAYNTSDGTLAKTIFEEESNEWVEPCTPAMFVNNGQFAWISERDGFKHIYLYNLSDGKCRQLTSGNWCVCELYGVNKNTGEIFFQANEQGYLTRDIYKVSLKGKMTRISNGYGVHNADFSPNGEYFVDNHSAPTHAMLSTLRDTRNGAVTDTLKDVGNTYEGYTLPIFRTVELKSADKKFDLCGVMILPADFDSTKTYPVIDYMYGGPHSQLINASWHYGTSDWKMYFAQQGYIVFSMDNRGTENRGVEYEHCIHRQLGKCEMEDQMVGVNYLKSLPYVDSTRIGIHGWSFGGFMTISMMEEHNAEFKAGVAGGPVCDWSLYEVMYGERYMDTPQENPEGYANSCVADKIGNLKGRLLVIHGDIDGTVVWQNSLKLLQNAVNADVIVDYAVYPQHEHNVVGPDRVHLFKRILQYFNDFLAR